MAARASYEKTRSAAVGCRSALFWRMQSVSPSVCVSHCHVKAWSALTLTGWRVEVDRDGLRVRRPHQSLLVGCFQRGGVV